MDARADGRNLSSLANRSGFEYLSPQSASPLEGFHDPRVVHEAGEALGIPAGTARSRLHRARKRLRAALAQTGAETAREEHDNA